MKKNIIKKCLVVAFSVLMLLGISSCGENPEKAEKSSITPGNIEYPIEGDVKLTYWVRLNSILSNSFENFGETEFAKKLMENTGVELEYIHPAQGQEDESLNLLIASGNLPDIIESNWLSRNPSSSIKNNVIISLNELMEQGYTPNLKKFLEEKPDIDRAVKTDNGEYYVFPFLRNGDSLLSTSGFMLREDWLKELNLEVPTTIEEWEIVLAAFKEKKGATAPLLINKNEMKYLAGAFGISDGLYIDDGKVHYGACEEEYLDYLRLVNDWYNKGYIDKNFAVMDNDFRTAHILDGYGGATFGSGGSQMGLYIKTAHSNGNEEYSLVTAPFIAKNKGETPEFGNKNWVYSPMNGAAITTSCKDQYAAAALLDYSYGKDGHMLNNFGIEGVSYEMVDGKPVYTDLIKNNSEGLSMAQMLPRYARSANEGPFIQDPEYIEQYYETEAQRNALKVWSVNNDEKHRMPQVTLTEEETLEYNKIRGDLETYVSESFLSFVIGAKPFDEFDEYVAKCKEMGSDRLIEIQQKAYERFNAR